LQFDEHLQRVGPEHVWVAELDGGVVGLTGLIPGEGEAELEPLVVADGHRGRGIGRQLAAAVVEASRARGDRMLNVRPVARNTEAVRAFHALGFDVLGHVQLFMDLAPEAGRQWLPGERLADRDVRR
jgi:GNAT superfamily N-acetyltransferase